ncbi:very low-density lipoprotein receptor-like [Pteropus vampyrus]|uniref:Very low-density lipoprotein receptor-like n=1 Tax=Pteropus vampyrus TaxID=132908 RepID=A0A6P6D2P6_PTEVA|nr:very low-density lipoprotein receptor-like [Pteropus vampyrus]
MLGNSVMAIWTMKMSLTKHTAPGTIAWLGSGSARTRCVSWRAGSDSINDCGDSSDEEICASCPEGMIRCDKGKCILESLMCDAGVDCADGTDEPTTCGKNCSLANGGCEGQCSDTNWGVRCSCGTWWQLQLDGQSCGDDAVKILTAADRELGVLY